MLYSAQTRVNARNLRKEGKTYREICNTLNIQIPKGTLSSWLYKIKLSPEYYKRIKLLNGNNIEKAQAYNRSLLEKRLTTLRLKNIDLVREINISVGKLILATLYWCEGGKYPSKSFLQFGSSDTKMIKLFLFLLRKCYQVDESKFRLTVQCRSDQDTIELRKYWMSITEIPWDKHYQPRIDKRSIGKPTQKINYHGVCVINYFDSNLQCELQFLGEYLGTDSAISQMINQIK